MSTFWLQPTPGFSLATVSYQLPLLALSLLLPPSPSTPSLVPRRHCSSSLPPFPNVRLATTLSSRQKVFCPGMRLPSRQSSTLPLCKRAQALC
eukprot:2389410-Pleurochrysis_carterae.AAC.1